MNKYWEEFREQFEDELREEAFKKFRKEAFEEVKKEITEDVEDRTKIETAAKLLGQKKMSEKEVAEFFNFSDSQMKSVKKQITVLA